MAAGEPRILVYDASEPLAEPVVSTLPQCSERAGRRHDRIVVYSVARADFRDFVGHPGAAGHPVDDPPGPFEHAMQDAFGGGHLPQHIHVNPALAAGALMRDARLLNAPGDRVRHQFFMAFEPGASSIDLRDRLPVLGIAVGIHPGEGTDPTGSAPSPGTLAIRHRNALAALDERQNLSPGYHEGIERFHDPGPLTGRRPQPDWLRRADASWRAPRHRASAAEHQKTPT